jgi:signal transduction histidine kinase
VRISAWLGFLAGGLVAAVVYFLLPNTEHMAALASTFFAYSSAVAIVVGVRRHRPTTRAPWNLIAGALVAIGTGDALLLASPVRDLADVCFLATYVALTLGLLRLVRARSHGRDIPALLDALVVTIGLGVVSWQFLMVPYARDPSLSVDQKLTSIVLPLADVVVLAVLVRLWSGGGHRPAAYWLLGLSIVSLLMADTTLGVLSLETANNAGYVAPGSPIDALFMSFLLGCAAAALHPSMTEVAAPSPPVTARRPRWRLALLGGAAILAPAVQMLEWLRGRPIEVPVVAAGSIVMFLLIVARTHGLTREVTVQDERRRLLGRVLQAAEDERTRIAHDLHDGPVQQLAVLNYDVYRARKRIGDLLGRVSGEALMEDLQGADEVLEGVEKGLGEETRVLRQLMSALRPPVLDNRGLAEALNEHAQRFEQEHQIAVDVGLGLEDRVAPELETILYRITQESLTNVAKHAKASRVSVTVDQLDDGMVRLRVRDDGVGFDAGNGPQLLREGHFGLAGMRERASLIGGTLEVGSLPGHGTTIEARLPSRLPHFEPTATS